MGQIAFHLVSHYLVFICIVSNSEQKFSHVSIQTTWSKLIESGVLSSEQLVRHFKSDIILI